MSPDDREPPLPEALDPNGDVSDGLLSGLTPEAVEIQPIPGAKKATNSPEAAGESAGRKRKKKVHAPDPKAKHAMPELPLADEPGIGDLPEFPVLRQETDPPGEDTAVIVEELAAALESTEALSSDAEMSDVEGVVPAKEENGATEADEGAAAPASPEDIPPSTAAAESGELRGPSPFLSRLDAGDRKWLVILLAGLLVVGGGFYFLLRSGLPVESTLQAQEKPDLPIKGAKVTIRELEMDWKDEGDGSVAGGLKANTLLPRISLRFEAGGSGAVRIFFRDERDQLVGDTVDVEPGGGSLDHVITCTAGLRSRLEYDALRARGSARWTVDIYEGPKPGAPLSEFQLLQRLVIPWNLDRKSSP